MAAGVFGVGAQMTAFTIAFQIPNLVRALFADLALTGAFVPVFSELIERGNRREAFRVASTLLFLMALVLGALTGLFMLFAPVIMPLFLPGLPELTDLTVGLSRLLFPIVLMLAISGLIVGMLNSFEHFSVPALAPLAWNLVIIAALVGLVPVYPEGEQIYAYAVGVVAGTLIQLLLPMPWLRGRGGRFTLAFDWRNPHVRQVLRLMLPVTLALGLINFSLVINSIVGSLVSVDAPAAIDKAFRIYMLPQGIFSIAIATILFPTLSKLAARGDFDEVRNTMANGVRQMSMFLIPSAVVMAVLSEPIIRLVYQRGRFDAAATEIVATALLWWAASLPFQGASLLFSRTFFSLQSPWVNTALAGLSLVVNAAVSYAFYKPLGVAGVVLGTVVATIAMTLAQAFLLRRRLAGIDGPRTLSAGGRMLLAAGGLGVVSYFSWGLLDRIAGDSLAGQLVAVGGAIVLGTAVYAALVWVMRVPEAAQAWSLVAGRLRRGGP